MLWLFAVIVLLVVFSVTMNERKREFAIFRVLGATQKKLAAIYSAVKISKTETYSTMREGE